VHPLQVRPRDARPGFQRRALEIAHWRDRRAAEDALVELRQFPPVPRDQVGVDVFSIKGQGHLFSFLFSFSEFAYSFSSFADGYLYYTSLVDFSSIIS
jgi:hypothetical protein